MISRYQLAKKHNQNAICRRHVALAEKRYAPIILLNHQDDLSQRC